MGACQIKDTHVQKKHGTAPIQANGPRSEL